MSSRLLSMKSANALLELPATGETLPAGTLVQAILLSDISSFPQSTSSKGTATSLHQDHAVKSSKSTSMQVKAASPEKVKVAILTVSDTVASGAGPNRRYVKLILLLIMDDVIDVVVTSVVCSKSTCKQIILY